MAKLGRGRVFFFWIGRHGAASPRWCGHYLAGEGGGAKVTVQKEHHRDVTDVGSPDAGDEEVEERRWRHCQVER